MFAATTQHLRIIGALIMREITTRFGREGLGFAWVIGEPLIFCFGVVILWSLTKPAYEHGIRVAAFVMSGYMCLILIRHLVASLANALQANLGLLYHRKISPLHIFSSRAIIEIGGTTAAFIVVYLVLFAFRQIGTPRDILLIYLGWIILAWLSTGFSLVLAGLAMRYEIFERLVGLISYLLIPLSGAFAMVAWLPPDFQKVLLMVPFVHAIEMIRAGMFSEFVPTHYTISYPIVMGAIFNALGLALIAGARDRIAVE